jgi:KipI family sensor histidine kinase inhibitor
MCGGCRYFSSGDRGIIIQVGNEISERVNEKVSKMIYCIKRSEIKGITEIVHAYDSILIIYEPLVVSYISLIKRLDMVCSAIDAVELPRVEVIHIPVLYGGIYGEDIDYVAKYNGLTPEEVIDIHSEKNYLVYMIGFTPGFPYLGGMSEKISTPRLESPRERVPGGSVGIAGAQTGIYPVLSPGGWRIIGRTPLMLFDPKRDPIFLLDSGNYVRFEPINEETYNNILSEIKEGKYIVRKSFL